MAAAASSMSSSAGVHTWRSIALGGKREIIQGVLKMNKDGLAWRSKGGQSVTVVASDIDEAAWTRLGNIFQLTMKTKSGLVHKLDGFREGDETFLKNFFHENWGTQLQDNMLCTKGWNWGSTRFKDSAFSFIVDKERAFEVPLNEVSKATAKGNEVVLEFHQDDTTSEKANTMVEMRITWPKEDEAKEKSQAFLQRVLAKADVSDTSGKGILTLSQIPILTPRGRYDIEMHPSFMRLHGKSFDYKVHYESMVRLFQLPHPGRRQMMFVVSLEPAIRHGATTYPHVVMQLDEKDNIEPKLALKKEHEDDERLKQLKEIQAGPVYQVVSRVFKILTAKKITIPKTFKSKDGGRAIKCSLKANEGFLYPLERSFFFVHKPPTHIRFEEINSVDFLRVNTDSTNRTFDFGINLHNGNVVMFKSMPREEYSSLFQFITSKQITILNFKDIKPVESSEGPKGKKRSLRGSVSDTRSRVKRAMQQEEILEDESDEDFGQEGDGGDGREDVGPVRTAAEDDDVDLASEEIDSASDLDDFANEARELQADAGEDNKNLPKKKRKRSETGGGDDADAKEEKAQERPPKKLKVDEGDVSSTTTTPTANPQAKPKSS